MAAAVSSSQAVRILTEELRASLSTLVQSLRESLGRKDAAGLEAALKAFKKKMKVPPSTSFSGNSSDDNGGSGDDSGSVPMLSAAVTILVAAPT